MIAKSGQKSAWDWLRGSRRAGPGQPDTQAAFALVRHSTDLQDIARVERHLPDILGRALARGWIDPAFSHELMADPKALLARYNVHLPASVSLVVEVTETGRQRIVVYDTPPGAARRRVMYLQLVMMAGH